MNKDAQCEKGHTNCKGPHQSVQSTKDLPNHKIYSIVSFDSVGGQ